MDKKLDTGEEPVKRRIDLSVAQVAGSAVAAVVAAVLASQLGVYGTVIGAGVVSVVATSGGTIFQHFFRRTGEQLREVTVHAKPKGRQPYVDDATRVLRSVEVPTGLGKGQPSEPSGLPGALPEDGEFTEATVHGTRVRGWKRSAIGAAVVFAVAMGGITTYELLSGHDLSDGKGTSVVNFVRGGGEKKDPPAETPTTTGPGSSTPDTDRTPGKDTGGRTPGPGTSASTGTGTNGTGGQETPDPGATTPAPDPSKDAASGGGESPPPTSPAKETPKGNADSGDGKGTDGTDAARSAAGGAERAPASAGSTQAP
ncbi:hypothetical protein [Streptomyces sp. NPDC048442]|uniref:hypothetical protein n=1 Tax=Streptomyces sp. NPDC048442 TaxID=3154823 RepID=UPI00342A571F